MVLDAEDRICAIHGATRHQDANWNAFSAIGKRRRLSGMGRFAPILFVLIATAMSAQDKQPTLKETLEWMHNAFPESRSASEFRLGHTREFIYVDGKNGVLPSCIVTIVDHWKGDGNPKTRDTVIDLSLIDPDSIKWYTDDLVDKETGELTFVATNEKKIIVEKLVGERNDKPPYQTEREFVSFIGPGVCTTIRQSSQECRDPMRREDINVLRNIHG